MLIPADGRSCLISIPRFAIPTLLVTIRALACSCVPTPPPCQAVGESELVFLGTVTAVEEQTDSSFKAAQMIVDRVFKGALTNTVKLFDDGVCDGPDLQTGKQYLMYTSSPVDGVVPSRGCTRSRPVEYATEDLQFLEQYSAGTVDTKVYGRVRFRPDEPDDADAKRTPLNGVQVTLSGPGITLRASTPVDGNYSFSAVRPGIYTIDAARAGYRLDWKPPEMRVAAHSCAVADLLMKVDRRVTGFITDEGGVPVPRALVEMVPADAREPGQFNFIAFSDDHGKYAMEGIAPGAYYLGTNIQSVPTKEHPYSTLFYPNTPTRAGATQIIVAKEPAIQHIDLRPVLRLPVVVVHGRLRRADGKSPDATEHPEVRIKEPGFTGQVDTEPIQIDSEGEFEYQLCQGVTYVIFAFSGHPTADTYSTPVEFTPSKDRLILMLDKTADEFENLVTSLRQPLDK